jgi:lipopolysaccharide export system protein LptA
MDKLRVNLVCMILVGLGVVFLNPLQAQDQKQTLTLRADIQKANARTGVITAVGNVQISYPRRQFKATAAQAQYFTQERRILLEGDVLIEHEGHNLQADKITYLMDEGRLEAQSVDQTSVETNLQVPE